MCEWLVFTYCNVVDSDITYHRYDSFIKSPTTNLRALMPAQSSLFLHVLCSAYQAGWVWGNTVSQIPPPPTEEWGWIYHNGELRIQWTQKEATESAPSAFTLAIKICQCRKALCKQCKCTKEKRPCLIFCKCQRKCILTA